SSLAPTTAAKPGQSGSTQAQSTSTGTSTTTGAATPAAKPAAKPQAPAVAMNTAPTRAPTAPAKPAKPPVTHNAAATAAPSATDDTNTTAASADANSGTPASPPGSRFAVQLGAFANDANARNWAAKLKAAGVPAYTEHRKQA
ncbi:SPOR domain-containing protein, partial [Burkholderia gladioli]|uniref:SPOR domain-containing protein n=1 Tax=Burkholderia gladioli TaxID=28095 RepID=UPI001641FDDE